MRDGFSNLEETTVHKTYSTVEDITETKVSSTYRNELSKQITTSLSTESNEESSSNVSKNFNSKDDETLSTLTQANEIKADFNVTRPKEVTTIKYYTDNTTDRNIDDSSGLTNIHISIIIGGSIGLVVLCIVIFVVFQLKKKRALAETAVYSYVNAVYQPPESQNNENELIFTE